MVDEVAYWASDIKSPLPYDEESPACDVYRGWGGALIVSSHAAFSPAQHTDAHYYHGVFVISR